MARASAAGAAGTAWSFDATSSRKRAAERRFLEGRRVFLSDKVKPKPSELKLVVEAAGGSVLARAPKKADAEADADHDAETQPVLVVTTNDERSVWAPLAKQRHVVCIRAEHFLSCVLSQELKLGAAHVLKA